MSFAPGDIVECVIDTPLDVTDAPPIRALTRGALYTVRDIIPKDDGQAPAGWRRHKDGIRVAEVVLPTWEVTGEELAWAAERFRPVYRPDPKLIELLQRVPELEDA